MDELKEIRSKLRANAQKKVDEINRYIKVLDSSDIENDDNFETIVFKLYIQLDSVTRTAKELNRLGFRLKTSRNTERKYTSNDITEIIKNKNADVDLELKEIVQRRQRYNYNKAEKKWF